MKVKSKLKTNILINFVIALFFYIYNMFTDIYTMTNLNIRITIFFLIKS